MKPIELFKPVSDSARVSGGLLVLRLVVGLAFLFHGHGKIQHPFGWMGLDAIRLIFERRKAVQHQMQIL